MVRTVYAVDATAAAKHLGIGRNTLLSLLRENGYTHEHAQAKNLPKKEFRQAGYFTTQLTEYWQGQVKHLHEKLMITASGMELCREIIEATQPKRGNRNGTTRPL